MAETEQASTRAGRALHRRRAPGEPVDPGARCTGAGSTVPGERGGGRRRRALRRGARRRGTAEPRRPRTSRSSRATSSSCSPRSAKRDEYLALAQRTQADFENYRKRVARDAAVAQERGVAKLARELLPALDNLDRALEAAAEEDPLLEGVRLVRTELAAALGRVGIESFSPTGEAVRPRAARGDRPAARGGRASAAASRRSTSPATA